MRTRAAVGAHVDAATDQVARHRVQRLGDFDVMIPMDLRRGVDRQVVTLRRCRQQPWLLLDGEHFERAGTGWCHGSAARPAPDTTPRPAVGRRRDRRTSPRRRTRNARTARSARHVACPVGRRTRAGSIRKPRAWAYSTNAWFNRGSSGSASSTIADRLSGIIVAKHAAEERPRRLAPVDHVLRWSAGSVNHTKQCRE